MIIVYVRFPTRGRAATLLRLLRAKLLDVPAISRFSEDDCGSDGRPNNPTVLRLELADGEPIPAVAEDLKAEEVYSPDGHTIWSHAA